ncbi:hypothetical protein Hypma_008956 [Hypsizygus marmoreus]|uniref:Uncharacterized protein n=1 Tax=Hypsizygus marmoreus TaxID=39966 RepID=A0A369JSF8_HYPMA|nr:hypothetical protein Hypma_008956 [Hypsizygus marmoreus]
MFNRNKDRLYLAYYYRGAAGKGYHVALLLTPKNPSQEVSNCYQYHATNPPAPGGQVWKFQPLRVPPRTDKLLAALLLGKTEHDNKTIENLLLEQVPVVQGDPVWRCRHWCWNAIQTLIDHGIIAPLDGTPQEVWQRGIDFASTVVLDSNFFSSPVPTCDQHGVRIDSELVDPIAAVEES